jgi:elongation factor P hydroxylase
MSNSRKSATAKDLKKFDKLVQGYEERLARQRASLDRLVAAHTVHASALHDIEHEAASIRSARLIASKAAENVKAILAVPKED